MGITTFRRYLLELLQKHAHKWVKEILPEELLTFSFLDRSISFQRLNLQEDFLDNFGIKLPLLVETARLENVVLTAVSSHVIRVEAKRIVLHAKVLPQDGWVQELEAAHELEESLKALRLQRHEAAATGTAGSQQAGGGLLCVIPSLELDLQDVELVVQDWTSRSDSPFALAATTSRLTLGKPLALENVVQPKERNVLHLDLRFQTYQMFLTSISLGLLDHDSGNDYFTHEGNRVLGPCDEMQLDLRISSAAEMSNKEHFPRPADAPAGMGHEVSGEESLPMVSLALRTIGTRDLDRNPDGCSLSCTQRQLANLIKHGRMWGMWFMCAQMHLGRCPSEEDCMAYRIQWLERCAQLVVADVPDSVPQDPELVAFEEQWPYRTVLRERSLALMRMDNAPVQRQGQPGVWPREPGHATTFLLDVDVSNTVVELKQEATIQSTASTWSDFSIADFAGNKKNKNSTTYGSPTLRVVPLDPFTTQTVRYLLHVDNKFDTQPISNEILLSNCRLEFVEGTYDHEKQRMDSTPLLDINKSYSFFDLVEHSDPLLCPEQPPRRMHVHLGHIRGMLALSSFFYAVNVTSGALDEAELEANPWDKTPLELRVHCEEVAHLQAMMPPPSHCRRITDTRVAASGPIAFLVSPEDDEKGVVLLQMKPSVTACKVVRSGPLELGQDVILDPTFFEDDVDGAATGGVLSVTISQLTLWKPKSLPASLPKDLPPAASDFWERCSHTPILSARETRCDVSLSSLNIDVSPVVVDLSVQTAVLFISIAQWFQSVGGDHDTAGGPTLRASGTLLSTSSETFSGLSKQGSLESNVTQLSSLSLVEEPSTEVTQLSSLRLAEEPTPTEQLQLPTPASSHGDHTILTNSSQTLSLDGDLETLGSNSKPPTPAPRRESEALLQPMGSATLDTLDENNADDVVQGLPSDVVRIRVCIAKISLHLRESTSGECPLEVRLGSQQLDARACLTRGSSPALDELTYSLRRLSVMDPRQDLYLVYCGERPLALGEQSSKHQPCRHAITFDFQAGIEDNTSDTQRHPGGRQSVLTKSGTGGASTYSGASLGSRSVNLRSRSDLGESPSPLGPSVPSEGHLSIQPLWICSHWSTITKACASLCSDLQGTSFAVDADEPDRFDGTDDLKAKSKADVDASQPPFETIMAALKNWRLRFTLRQIVLLVPCDEANNLQICAQLNVTVTGSEVRLTASGLYVAISTSLQKCDFGSEVQFDENAILHPARLRFVAQRRLAEEDFKVVELNADMRIEPLHFSFYTDHVIVVTALWMTVNKVMEDLGETLNLVRQPNIDESPPEELSGVSEQTWVGVLRIQVEAVHMGIVDCKNGVEMCTLFLEESTMTLQRGFENRVPTPWNAADIHKSSSKSVVSSFRSNSSASTETDTKRLIGPSTRSSWGTSNYSPMLEASHTFGSDEPESYTWPVVINAHVRALSVNLCQARTSRPFPLLEPVRIHIRGLGTGDARCSMTWLNVNLSSAAISVLIRLLLVVSQERTRQPASGADGIALSSQPLARSISPFPVKLPLGDDQVQMTDSFDKGWIDVKGKGDGSIVVVSSNLHGHDGPSFKVQSHLGWKSDLRLRSNPGYEEDGKQLPNVTLRMTLPDGKISEAILRPTQRVQVLNLGKEKQTTMETLDKVMKRPLRESLRRAGSRLQRFAYKTWKGVLHLHVLARQETSLNGSTQDIHLSSVVFIENRCNVDLVIVPVCVSCPNSESRCAEAHQEPMVLRVGSKPSPIPLGWFTPCVCELFHPDIYCGLAERWFEAPTMLSRRQLVEQGRLRPLVNPATWKEMNRYHSNVAGDYFLSSSSLRLRNDDNKGGKATHLCANIYGISQDLGGMHSPLFFTVALEPLVQLCNRLCCTLKLSGGGKYLKPGEDAAILDEVGEAGDDFKAELKSPIGSFYYKGHLKSGRVTRTEKSSIYFVKGTSKKEMSSPSSSSADWAKEPSAWSGRSSRKNQPKLEAVLWREPGVCPDQNWWGHLEVFPYKPQSYRITIFTKYWVINRRSDCNIFIVHGHSANYARDRDNELLQVPAERIRMLPEQIVFRGRIRIGLLEEARETVRHLQDDNHPYTASPAFQQVSGLINVSQPTEGVVRIPGNKRYNRDSKSFGYTVQAESGPFYRTMIIQIVRRYTIVNHKSTGLVIKEKGNLQGPFHLAAGEVKTNFDPQGRSLELAIAGWSSGREDKDLKALQPEHFSAYFSIDMEKKSDRFHLHHRHHQAQHRRMGDKYMGDDILMESDESQLVETVEDGLTEEQRSARGIFRGPTAFLSEAQPVHHQYSITAVDMVVDSGAVMVSFSDAVRPSFRMVNRTGHTLHLRQTARQDARGTVRDKFPFSMGREERSRLEEDEAQAPIVELRPTERPEDALEFAWFNPWKDTMLDIWRLGSDDSSMKHQFDIEQVQKHPQKLKVRKALRAMPSLFDEEFVVQTMVNNGCREVHFRPWCRVVNRRESESPHASVFLQTGEWHKGKWRWSNPVELFEGEHVCLQPMQTPMPQSRSETLPLRISSHSQTDEADDKSGIILLKARHTGKKGYVRHPKPIGDNLVEGNSNENNEITEVVVERDSMSSFLNVELWKCKEAPYMVENQSKKTCTIAMATHQAQEAEFLTLGPASNEVLHIPPGEKRSFIPQNWNAGSTSGRTCEVDIAVPDHGVSQIIDFDYADVMVPPSPGSRRRPSCYPIGDVLMVYIYSGTPRRIVLKDPKVKQHRHHTYKKGSRKTHMAGSLTALKLFGRKIIHPNVIPALRMTALPRRQHARRKGSPHYLSKATAAAKKGMQYTENVLEHAKRPLAKTQSTLLRPMATIEHLGRLLRQHTTISTPTNISEAEDGYLEALSPCTNRTISKESQLHPSSATKASWNLGESPQTPQGDTLCIDFRCEGLGVALLDSIMLKEVAYVSVTKVHVFNARGSPHTELKVKIDTVQVDVRDRTRSNKWSSGRVVLLPWLGSGIWKKKKKNRKSQPLINFLAKWRFDGDLKNPGAGHIDLQELQLKVMPLEVRMDTEHLLVVAEWVKQLHRSLSPLQGEPNDQDCHSDTVAQKKYLLGTVNQEPGEDGLGCKVREPNWIERSRKEDFKAPTPIFVRRLEIRRIEVVVSWRFSGFRGGRGMNAGDELQRWHYILKKALPFDLTQASFLVGRHRVFNVNVLRHRVTDIAYRDMFYRNGFPDLAQAVGDEYLTAFLWQTGRLVTQQNLFLNVPRLLMDVRRALQLALGACVRVKPWLLMAAVFFMLAAVLQSVEDFLTTVAKTLCHWCLYRTPYALRREPEHLTGIFLDAVQYSFAWHFYMLANEWNRLLRHARSSRNWYVVGRCPLLALGRLCVSLISSVLVILAKLLQFFNLLCRLTGSWLANDTAVIWTPSLCRAGPQQYYMGAPMQFSLNAAMVLSAAGFYGERGREAGSPQSFAGMHEHGHWQMMKLPDGAGLLLAVRERGFFLVSDPSAAHDVVSQATSSSRVTQCCRRDVFQTELPTTASCIWKATGAGWMPPDLMMTRDGREDLPLIRLQRNYRRSHEREHAVEPELLKLESLPAVMTAYGFIRDFLAAG